MNSKRILFINDTLLSHGGAETYMYALKNLLDQNGYDTCIVGGEKGVGLSDSFFSRWYSVKYYQVIKETIELFNPDIIHLQSFARVLSPSVLLAAHAKRIPIVQTVHDYHYICPKVWMINDTDQIITEHNSFMECLSHHLPKKSFFYDFFKSIKAEYHKIFLNRYIDHFICPSTDLQDWYIKKYSAQKVSFIPNFVDESDFNYCEVQNYTNLLYVGRLSKEKGISLLVKAFSHAISTIPNLQLTIIGDGPEKKTLQNLCRQLGIEKNISFISKVPHDNLATYYHQSSVVIVPSIWVENCPMVALEAIATGRPVIGANAGGLKDLIYNDINGYLFTRNNVNDLTNKILLLLSNKKNLLTFNKNQQKKSVHYNKNSHLEKIENIYNYVEGNYENKS